MMRFLRNDRGNVAIVFGLMMVPAFAAVGASVDYVRVSAAKTYLQAQIDAAALSIAASNLEHDPQAELDFVAAQMNANGGGISDVSVTGRWMNASDYEITATARLGTVIIQVVPGMADSVAVSALAVARVETEEPFVQYKEPAMAWLEPEAGDYNRIYAYCYNHAERNNPETHGRTQMTAIADNAQTPYEYTMPRCKEGETLSLRLHNVRNARWSGFAPQAWDDPTWQNFQYYSDTQFDPQGVEQFDLGGWAILETVHCKTLWECTTPKHQGGKIPTGRDRTPERHTTACKPGEFLYFGWEDRPPPKSNGQAQGGDSWTDRDYDDIRIVLECPEPIEEQTPQKTVSLIR